MLKLHRENQKTKSGVLSPPPPPQFKSTDLFISPHEEFYKDKDISVETTSSLRTLIFK